MPEQEPGSRFLNWEEYPYQRFQSPHSWSLNVTPSQARHFVNERGHYDHQKFCVDVVTLDRQSAQINAALQLPRIETFNSERAFVNRIRGINRALQCTLIFVRSDSPVKSYDMVDMDGIPLGNQEQEEELNNAKGEACITASAVFKICTMFDIQQSFLVSFRKDPHFSIHRVNSSYDEDKSTRDVSYHMQMPWFHLSGDKVDVSPIPQYSVSVYSKYRENGQPMFSMFFNVQPIFINSIKEAWKLCVLEAESFPRLRLLDHWALLNASFARAQEACRFHEALYSIVFSNSRASHLGRKPTEGAWGTLGITVSEGSNVLDYLESMVLPLDSIGEVTKGLLNLQKKDFSSRRPDEAQNMQLKQEGSWSSSLQTGFNLIQKRNAVILKRAEREMMHLFNIIRLRDSETMSQNTAHMAKLAEAQQQSGAEMRQFSWDSRQDARLMKFLAQLTMIFLPITAVATTFSMDFFAIDQSSSALLPFSSLRYIWIFVIITGAVSLATWTVWWQRWKKLQLDDRRFRQELDEERKSQMARTLP